MQRDSDELARLVAQNVSTVKMAGRSFGREKNYGLTVTVSSESRCMLIVVQRKQPASLWPASQTSHKGEDPRGHEN